MTGYQGIIFSLPTSKGILSCSDLYAHQRVSWVHNVCSNVDCVDFLHLQYRGVAGVICALEVDCILTKPTDWRELIRAIKDFTCRFLRRPLEVDERFLGAGNLVVIIIDFPDNHFPVSHLLSTQ